MPLPAAVLWDMDGTLVDTEPYWIEAEHALAAEHGATWTHEQALQLVGSDLLDSGRYIAEQMGLTMSPAEVVDRLLDAVVGRVVESVPWRPGARELLAALREAGVPCALVTMSYRRFADPILAHLPPDTFDAVVTGDAVSRGKPDPEAYETAAGLLGVPPAEAVAIEDSETGCRSAEAAGCLVVTVPLHVPVEAGRTPGPPRHPGRDDPGRPQPVGPAGLSAATAVCAVGPSRLSRSGSGGGVPP